MACSNSLSNLSFLRGKASVTAFGDHKIAERLNFSVPIYSSKQPHAAAVSVSCSAVGNKIAAAISAGGNSFELMEALMIMNRTLSRPSTVRPTPPNLTSGKFGRFGGKFVPETLITCLNLLELEFNSVLTDADFQVRQSFVYLLIKSM